ncbi:MAG: hypothetical protein MI744_20970 [Pseudomonadales bacterium]|nr:hypothetical protein [Pseudomonadales bacterium]
MLVEAMKHIEEMKRPETITDGTGREYMLRGSEYVPVTIPTPETLNVETLTAIKDYLRDIRDPKPEGLFLHIVDYRTVRLYGPYLDKSFCERPCLLEAHTPDLAKDKGIFSAALDQASFIISTFTLFDQTDDVFNAPPDEMPDLEYLRHMASHITSKSSADLKDNGMTQSVTVRKGLSGNVPESVKIRPIVVLRPYRSFREVSPVKGLFNFRMQERPDEPPTLRLIEADGGAWRLETIKAIKDYLTTNLEIDVPIIA